MDPIDDPELVSIRGLTFIRRIPQSHDASKEGHPQVKVEPTAWHRARVHAAAATAVVALLLTGCTFEVEAEADQAGAPIAEAPQPTPQAPNPTPVVTPDPPERVEVDLIVNYTDFRNWNNLNAENRQGACNNFYEQNGLTLERPLTQSSNGEEILRAHYDKVLMAYDLNLNKSNDQNGEIALKLVDCLTAIQGDTENATRNIYNISFPSSRGSSFEMRLPTIKEILQYSAEPFIADSTNGNYLAHTVKYVEESEGGVFSRQEVFKYSIEEGWQSVAIFLGDTDIPYGNKPPIVLGR